jgi:hypothetical protein
VVVAQGLLLRKGSQGAALSPFLVDDRCSEVEGLSRTVETLKLERARASHRGHAVIDFLQAGRRRAFSDSQTSAQLGASLKATLNNATRF